MMDISELQWVAIAAMAGTTGVIISFIFNYVAQREAKNAQFANLITNFTIENTRLIQRETNLKTVLECYIHLTTYLDLLQAIAFLALDKKIPHEVSSFFNGYFGYGLLMLEFHEKYFPKLKKEIKSRWPSMLKWCAQEKDIQKDEEI